MRWWRERQARKRREADRVWEYRRTTGREQVAEQISREMNRVFAEAMQQVDNMVGPDEAIVNVTVEWQRNITITKEVRR